MRTALLISLFAALSVADAAELTLPPIEEILPPVIPWSGKSETLIVAEDDPWITPAERDGITTSPSYEETVLWLRRLVNAAPELRMVSIGKSPEGRDLWMVIASRERRFSPEGLKRSGKPTILAQAGIHAGEIDGMDAGLMLLRDMTVRGTERRLLEGANILFVPIFNVDGHARRSRFSRINQRGPEEQGWRTTSRNLNLNRDYAKADTPEMRAMLAVLGRWDPDLYLDLHVTDGADYQYDITFGWTGPHGWSPAIGAWLDETLGPALTADLRSWGHIPGPLIFGVGEDLRSGLQGWTAPPRFSNGYGDARHVPTVLVENHSLKPYRQRVLGTYVLMKSALETAAAHHRSLRSAIETDRARRASPVPLAWRVPESGVPMIDALAIESRERISPITGGVVMEWLGVPTIQRVEHRIPTEVSESVERPAAYWIPPAWPELIERLVVHGIRFERIDAPRELEVEMLRLVDPVVDPTPFEGHVRVSTGVEAYRTRWSFPAGSVRVSTDQPLGTLATLLLEPLSTDSFFQWGFLLEPLSRTEYVEAYVLEPLARRMLEENPALEAEFRNRLADDAEFRQSESLRLEWFYEKTPWFDPRWRLYPIGREVR